MATNGGDPDRSVAERLAAEPYRFDFFQAVSLLERMRPDATPVGEGVHPQREAVHFAADPDLAFPSSEIAGIEPPPAPSGAWTMRVPFMALAGVQGPLPRVYAERMLGARSRTGAVRAFLDIFHHRLVSIFYRARRSRRLGMDGRPPDKSIAAPMLRALVGLGTEGLTERLAVPDRAILRCAGVFALRPRSVAGLRAIVAHYFGVPARIEQFVGRWREIEPEDTTRLGARFGSNVLGESAVLGTRVWDQTAAIRIVLGPLSGAQYRDLLPNGSALTPLGDLVRLYVGPELDVEFQLVLRAADTPSARLDRSEDAALGWTSWLGMRDRPADPRVSVSAERN